jgi:GAF domain-containing protein
VTPHAKGRYTVGTPALRANVRGWLFLAYGALTRATPRDRYRGGRVSVRLSIGQKLAALCLILIVPFVAVTAWTYVNRYQVRVNDALDRRTDAARLIAATFEVWVTEVRKTMDLVGADIYQPQVKQSVAQQKLEVVTKAYPAAWALTTNASGTVTVATKRDLVGTDLSAHPGFASLLAGRGLGSISPGEDVAGVRGFYVTTAIRDSKGNLRGVVATFIDVARLHESLPLGLPNVGGGVSDSNGILVYQNEYPKLALERARFGRYPFIAAAKAGTPSRETHFVFPVTGEVRLAAAVPVPGVPGWVAGSSISAQAVLRPFFESLRVSMLMTILGVTVAVFVAVYLARGIQGSARYLADASARLGAGDFDHRVRLATGDEMETVARTLDETRLRLKTYVNGLATITTAGRDLSSSLDPRHVAEATVEGAQELLGAIHTCIYIYGHDAKALHALLCAGACGRLGLVECVGQQRALWAREAEAAAITSVDDLGDPDLLQVVRGCGARALIDLPLRTGKGPLGLAQVFSAMDTHEFEDKGELLEAFTAQVSASLGNALLYAESRVLQTKLAAAKDLSDSVNVVNETINATLEVQETLGDVLAIAAETVGADAALVAMVQGDHWMIREVWQLPKDLERRSVRNRAAFGYDVGDVSSGLLWANTSQAPPDSIVAHSRVNAVLDVPLLIGEDVVGDLALFLRGSEVSFTPEQIDFANKVAASVGLALRNSLAYQTEHSIAETLQESLLTLPKSIEGVEFGSWYQAATGPGRVGGDFFDLFELERDRVGILLGDVAGKGLRAATLTAFAKNAVHAYAMEHSSPGLILRRTNRLLHSVTEISSFVTIWFGILDRTTGHLVYSTGGHPPALLRHADGSVEELALRGPIVGAFLQSYFDDAEAVLVPGSMLVLYSDGVVETRDEAGAFLGVDRLRDLVSGIRATPRKAARKLFGLVSAFGRGQLPDDVAILTIGPTVED